MVNPCQVYVVVDFSLVCYLFAAMFFFSPKVFNICELKGFSLSTYVLRLIYGGLHNLGKLE